RTNRQGAKSAKRGKRHEEGRKGEHGGAGEGTPTGCADAAHFVSFFSSWRPWRLGGSSSRGFARRARPCYGGRGYTSTFSRDCHARRDAQPRHAGTDLAGGRRRPP